jgi:hypothetical protein
MRQLPRRERSTSSSPSFIDLSGTVLLCWIYLLENSWLFLGIATTIVSPCRTVPLAGYRQRQSK